MRECERPFTMAGVIHDEYQAVDDPVKLADMAEYIKRLDLHDYQTCPIGRGVNAPGIQEAGTICVEDLEHPKFSIRSKIVLLQQFVPVMFSLKSGEFGDLLTEIRGAVGELKASDSPRLAAAAASAEEKMMTSGKIFLRDQIPLPLTFYPRQASIR